MIIITHERDKCIGCGACVAACAENWKMDDDGKTSPIKKELTAAGCNKDAADACPVEIIHLQKK
jgi:ferredoxin